MARNKWALSAELRAQIEEIGPQVRDALDDMRSDYDGMSERWLEGERGEAVGQFLDQLEELADAFDNVTLEADL